jgi:hypothetical protein
MKSRRIRPLALAVLAIGLAACGHSSKSSSSTSPGASTTTSGEATTTTSSVSASSTTTVSPVPLTPNCVFSQLSVTASGNSGAGHIGLVLVFKNLGTRTCKLMGYPGVAGLDAAGNQVIQATRTLNGFMRVLPAGQSPPVVTLATGQSASAFVEGTDVPTGTATSCPTYPKLLVTPPNTTQSVTIAMPMPGCSPVQVHPVVPGTTGSTVM